MLKTVVIVLISLCAVILLIGLGSLINTAMTKNPLEPSIA